jgi:O-antigen/teichoic acid export membrane protein
VSLKKDSLIKGTIILAAAALVARFLGIFQRVPLDYMLTEAGGTYFAAANTIYLLLLVIATGGIPSAISKMVSERYAQGRIGEAEEVYRAAIYFGIVSGILISGLLYIFAPYVADTISDNPGATNSIRAIAPTLLLFPVIAMMRGYFQGRQFMTAGGVSQIVEQILRVVTGVGIALVVLQWGYGDEWVAAAAVFGSVFGSIGAFAVMLWYAVKLRKSDTAERRNGRNGSRYGSMGNRRTESGRTGRKTSYREVYREIFSLSVPIVLTAMTVQFFYTFDANLFYRMTDAFYDSREAARAALDVLGMKAQSIAGIPPILAIALSQSIIPVISSAFAKRNLQEVSRQSSLVMRIVMFTGVPAALALTVAAPSVTGLIFPPGGEGVVAALTAGTILQITMMTTNSILFGMGKPRQAMYHTVTGMILKAGFSLALGPVLGVYGLIIASTLSFLYITLLNIASIRKVTKLQILGAKWRPYLIVISVTALVGWGVDSAGLLLLDGLPQKLASFLTAAAAGIAIAVVYLVLLVLLGVVTKQDAESFPGPLRKLFNRLLRLRMRV